MPSYRTEAAEHSLLPSLVEKIAQNEPEAIWGEYPKVPTSYDQGFTSITYSDFANAVNGVANIIETALDRSQSSETLAYLAPNGPQCAITFIAAMKAGFQIFLTSERNSVAAQLKLFSELNCSTIVTTMVLFPPLQAILRERRMTIIPLPALEDLLLKPQPRYRYNKDFNTAQNETAFVVHTSGSTGFPKPMRISHGYITKVGRNIGIEAPEGFEMLNTLTGNNRNVLLLPLSHPAGVHFGIFNPIFNSSTVVLPLPFVPPTGQTLVEILKHNKGDWATLAPLTLETISKNMNLLDEIAPNLKMLTFSGGSLPKVFGDIIATRIKLTSLLGSTESGPLPTMYRYDHDFERDWNYLQIHPAVGAKFDPQPGEVFELVYERSPSTEPHQTVFTLWPDLNEFRTKDLFSCHPFRPDLWTHASRSDDIIVFLNGEKTNPITFESHISHIPEVSAALMFGNQRFESGLLVELSYQKPLSTFERAETIERLWPEVERANAMLPAYAQVSQSHILFTEPNNPLSRTLKGSIRRQATLAQYASKINQLYADAEAAWAPTSGVSKEVDLESIETVQNIVQESLDSIAKIGEIGKDGDFFTQGMDSLQVLRLVRDLRMKTSLVSIQPSTIYRHSTVVSLAKALHDLAHNTQISQSESERRRTDKITTTLQKYSTMIDELVASIPKQTTRCQANPSPDSGSRSVILTGSTGVIGSYILRALLEQPNIDHIYCLNRSLDSDALQKKRNADTDPELPTIFPESKVTFLTTNLAEERALGFVPSIYEKLQRTVSLIIHNAWTVDFSLPLHSFEPQILGIVNLAVLSAQSVLKPPIMFLSSIGAVMNYASTVSSNSTVPESIIDDPSAPAATGYAESKYIAEKLLAYATQKLGLQACIIPRLGQITGATFSLGRWNRNEWLPSLIIGSRHMGAIPESLSTYPSGMRIGAEDKNINWLPVDTLADVLVEIGLRHGSTESEGGSIRVFHPFNPHRTSWSVLLPSIVAALEAHSSITSGHTHPIQIVSCRDWLEKLRTSATRAVESSSSKETDSMAQLLQSNPALKLIEFYEKQFSEKDGSASRPAWETREAEMASEKLRSAGAIDGTMMKRWVDEWCEE